MRVLLMVLAILGLVGCKTFLVRFDMPTRENGTLVLPEEGVICQVKVSSPDSSNFVRVIDVPCREGELIVEHVAKEPIWEVRVRAGNAEWSEPTVVYPEEVIEEDNDE